ncbi:hypothetical protein BDA96_09G118400 [Sorghum bicolor]|uniref:Uncharacterized protein n=1 Tax=Sorghum bicolor TaxID=4558 RepID=A0A921QBP3_SORBI|nr:hypothetical protein BDA96_09G118400 [Sorghum bicolor]
MRSLWKFKKKDNFSRQADRIMMCWAAKVFFSVGFFFGYMHAFFSMITLTFSFRPFSPCYFPQWLLFMQRKMKERFYT